MTTIRRRLEALERRRGGDTEIGARLDRLTDAELDRVEAIIAAIDPECEASVATIPPEDVRFLIDVGVVDPDYECQRLS